MPQMHPPPPRPTQQDQAKQQSKFGYYPFQNQYLKELIFQLEIYVQILYIVLLYQRAK